jgi:phospholipid/cholesterol/gamma-HCH transport system substrate-binding protein
VEPKNSPFDRPVTEEEIQQILRDRAERLDPANRPSNAEVDNGPRDWDYELNDFRDNIERRGGPPPDLGNTTEHGPVVERRSSLRLLGTSLILVCLFFGWLTWAIFSKAFVEYDDVKLTGSKSGLALPERADVKLRGMIVGVVRETQVHDGKVVMTLGMDPQLIERVPRDVRAEIIPKTLFGEKYISLVPTSGTSEHLRTGDTITNAVVPVEFEEFFNDVYPLLTAVPPEKVAYTLTALANSLEGRGDSLGQTLEDSNEYLKKFNPENRQAIADIVALGRVSSSYARQMDNLGELLRNSAEISETVTDKESELADFFEEGDQLADVLREFLEAAGTDIIATAGNSVQPLEVGAEYSTMFPCWFKGENALINNVVNEVFGNGTLHIAFVTVTPQPSRYDKPDDPQPEHPIIPKEATLESLDFAQPEIHGYEPNPAEPDDPFPAGLGTVCDELYAAARGNPRTPDEPFPYMGKFWKAFGVRNSHNGKLGSDADYQRSPVSSSLAGMDSPAQKEALKRMTAGLTGVKPDEVPDVASLLISPVVRGAAWQVAQTGR